MTDLAALLTLSDAYCKASGLAEATLSTRLLGAGSRLRKLSDGKSDIGVRRLAKALAWLSSHWPDGALWPAEIERPPPEGPPRSRASPEAA